MQTKIPEPHDRFYRALLFRWVFFFLRYPILPNNREPSGTTGDGNKQNSTRETPIETRTVGGYTRSSVFGLSRGNLVGVGFGGGEVSAAVCLEVGKSGEQNKAVRACCWPRKQAPS